jgi:FKBP12-rapamycin complex-associated protein
VTLWFRFGADETIQYEIRHQLSTTPVTGWLHAIPQLIARLGVDNDSLRATLVDLLKRVSFQYPHSMIWPLTAAQIIHKQAAVEIMDHICSLPDGSRLVAQAKMVSKELIRTSTSWLEK